MSLPADQDTHAPALAAATAREERYQALIAVARGMFPLVTLDELAGHLLAYAPSILGCAACTLVLPDKKARTLTLHASAAGTAGAGKPTPAVIPWDRGIAGRVFQEGLPADVPDPALDPAFLPDAEIPPGCAPGPILSLPLVYRQERLGVFQALGPIGRPAFDAFDRTLADGLASIATNAITRLERDREVKAMARMAGELAAAEEIQKALLPPEEVRLPHGLFLARYRAARSLGGDFYAVETLHDGSILVALGDVSGKGIPAALTTAQVTTEIGAMAARPVVNLAEFVGFLNRHLCARISAGRFIATTFLRYVPAAGLMEIARAGQFAPWRDSGSGWRPTETPASPPLGIDPNARFTVETLRCVPGERWLMASDGILEGRDSDRQEYGDERFAASLAASVDPFRQIERVWGDWENFVVADALHDDACLVLFTCLPPAAIRLDACPASCKQDRAYAEGWALAAGFGDEERGRIVLGADETFTNLLRHAHGGDAHGHPIFLSGQLERERLTLTLRTEAPFVDINQLEPRQPGATGGMGLRCIRQVFDEIECRPVEGLTETTLIKLLPGAGL